jgi:hypothetical protein
MIKKAWHILVSLWGGFLITAMIVGGVLTNVGLIPETISTRVTWIVMPFTAAGCYYLFYIYDGRSDEEKAAAKRQRHRR